MGLVNILLVLAVCWVKWNVYKLVSAETVEEQDILTEHNRYRKMHGCPPLTLDDSITKECKEYAKVCRGIPNHISHFQYALNRSNR